MRTSRTRRTSASISCEPFRHPFPPEAHPTWCRTTLTPLLMLVLSAAPTAPMARADVQDKAQAASARMHFLLFGTVFTEKGLALPGAEIAIRRAGEKKVRWRAISDRRGEFAVRVPGGAEYELTVTAKGYQDQTRKTNGRAGDREDMVFRMQPAAGEKEKKP